MRGYLLDRKESVNVVTEGISKSGEISPKGVVTHIEHWDGRVEVEAGPATQHFVYFKSTGQLRRKTLTELIAEGKFYVGKGPTGIRVRR